MEQTSKSIKEKYTVQSINTNQAKDWCLYKHYAGRLPSSVKHCFGCFEGKMLIGVCLFGQNGNYQLNNLNGIKIIELQRLIVNDERPENTTSFFVSQCLKKVNHKGLIVSFADTNQSHHGFIYQATNWLYTGLSGGDVEFTKNGVQYHRKNLFNALGTGSVQKAIEHGYEPVKVPPKHRYFYITGNRAERKRFKRELLTHYEVKPYPKGQNERYDASYKPTVQLPLF